MESFFEGYLTCALWSSTDNRDDSGGQPLDQGTARTRSRRARDGGYAVSGAIIVSGPFHGERRSFWYVLEESEPCANGDPSFDVLESFESREAAVIYMAELTQGRIEREAQP